MIKYCYTKLNALSLIVGMLLSFSSCGFSEEGVKTESYVTLQVKFPESESEDFNEKTRAGTPVDGEADESKITSLKFFVFKSANDLEAYQSITIDGTGHSSDPMWDRSTKALRITVKPGTKQIYCVANWTDGAQGMGALIGNTVSGGTISSTTQLLSTLRGHNGITPGIPLVMTGKKENHTINAADQKVTIDMVRQTSKVEVSAKLDPTLASMNAQVRITGIKFRNMPQQSYLFARSPGASPAPATVWHQTAFSGPTSVAESPMLTTTVAKYNERYFIPEHYANAVQASVTQMIIRAEYYGQPTYYRINMCADTQNPVHTSHTIERNHLYRYTVTIRGIGSSDENAATRAADNPGVANISYELEIK